MENKIVYGSFNKWNFFSIMPFVYAGVALLVGIILVTSDVEEAFVPFMLIAALFVGLAFWIANYYDKLSLIITEDWIYFKCGLKSKTTIPMKSVSFVHYNTSPLLHGSLSIHTAGGHISSRSLNNAEELFTTIVSHIEQ